LGRGQKPPPLVRVFRRNKPVPNIPCRGARGGGIASKGAGSRGSGRVCRKMGTEGGGDIFVGGRFPRKKKKTDEVVWGGKGQKRNHPFGQVEGSRIKKTQRLRISTLQPKSPPPPCGEKKKTQNRRISSSRKKGAGGARRPRLDSSRGGVFVSKPGGGGGGGGGWGGGDFLQGKQKKKKELKGKWSTNFFVPIEEEPSGWGGQKQILFLFRAEKNNFRICGCGDFDVFIWGDQKFVRPRTRFLKWLCGLAGCVFIWGQGCFRIQVISGGGFH